MKASSSRRFDKAATPTTMPESNGFAAKKEKRNERIGGTVGDFRRNGVQENAVVTPPVVPQLIPPTPAVVKAPFHTVPTPSPTLSTQIPISALDFESRWSQLSTPTLRRDYLRVRPSLLTSPTPLTLRAESHNRRGGPRADVRRLSLARNSRRDYSLPNNRLGG